MKYSSATLLGALCIAATFIGHERLQAAEDVSLEVDHVWVRVSDEAPEIAALIREGLYPHELTPSPILRHPGSGTASIFVRFENIYLELLWADEPETLRRERPELAVTFLDEPTASPFGIGLRKMGSDSAALPFETWRHTAEWLQDGTFLEFATRPENALNDPTVFSIPRYLRWDVRVTEQPELLQAVNNDLGLRELTRIRIFGPGLPSDSRAVQTLEAEGLVEFVPSDEHLLELEFDGHRERVVDLRPTLPLSFRY